MDTVRGASSYTVDTLESLMRIYEKPRPGVIAKETDYITAPGKAFIARSPFIVLATSSASGLDCSPKGDEPGFVRVLDERTLLIPDRPGNNRIDGMKNIVENPQVAVIFMVPGANETYRVNGTAHISVDPALLNLCKAQGKPPRAVIVVRVVQAFNHCPKAFVRARLWEAGARGRPQDVPTTGAFAAFRNGADEDYAARYDAEYATRLPNELY